MPIQVTDDYVIAQGQNLGLTDLVGIVLEWPDRLLDPPSLTNNGTITHVTNSPYIAVAIEFLGQDDPDRPAVFTNSSTGIVNVVAYGTQNSVKGIFAGYAMGHVVNDGTITVYGPTNAYGIETYNLRMVLENHGTLSVTSATHLAIGVWLRHGGTTTNSGVIEAVGNSAIAYWSGRESTLENSGTIRAAAAGGSEIAVLVEQGWHTVTTIDNSGLIEGAVAILDASDPDSLFPDAVQLVTNTGEIRGEIDLGQGNDEYINSGTSEGAVWLGRGDDLYDGAQGLQTGGVFGGEGDDQLIGGAGVDILIGGDGADTLTGGGGNDFFDGGRGSDIIDGGAGVDTLSYATALGFVEVDLASGIGVAGGTDQISNTENVAGSRYSDFIGGNDSVNVIDGGQGDDLIDGRGGADRLIGGRGADILTGGAGNDSFVFGQGDGGDRITDFVAGGAQDTLVIYGYTNYLELRQVGDDTLVVFSASDSILLEGVIASQLTSADFTFSAGARPELLSPVDVPTFGGEQIRLTEDEHIYYGETLLFDDVGSAVLINLRAQLVNAGTIEVHGHDITSGVFFTGRETLGSLLNEESGRLIVTADGPEAAAIGVYILMWGAQISNHGLISVTSAYNAIGIDGLRMDLQVTNTGTISVTAPDALGVNLGQYGYLVNTGLIEAVGTQSAYGVFGGAVRGFSNTGTIRAIGDQDTLTVGIQVYVENGVVENAGTIQAEIAVRAQGPDGDETVINSGVIHGLIDLENGGEFPDHNRDLVTNTGLINGQVLLGEGDDEYDGTLGYQQQGVFGGGGNDILRGGADTEVLHGGSGDDVLTGGGGDDTLIGDAGADLINGGSGADFMRGGLGDDYYFVTEAGDLVSEGSDLDVSTGVVAGGIDTVASTISYSLGVGVENLNLIGSGNINGTGNTGDNVINGNSGANFINGGAGADTMAGAGGNDTYIVDNDGDVVSEAFTTGGVDTVVYDVIGGANAYTLGANVENFRASANITAGLNITGNALANTITGGAGADFIDGGSGVDQLRGGAGNDTYVYTAGDFIGEAAGEGVDTVRSAVSYSAVVNIENIILTGSANINATGNTLTNQIYGNAGDNVINGGGSADFMRGGLGDDYYFVTEAGDLVSEGSDLDVSTGVVAGGVDTVASTISYSLGVGVENLNLIGSGNINGVGNTGDNVINGNAGANVLNGGVGADTMAGAGGNDTYIVDNDGDVVDEAFTTGGVDTVVYDVIGGANAYTLGANVENFRASGNITAGLNITGNALANTITGGAGNDFIDGGAGVDQLRGGAGNDTYVYTAGDFIGEAAGEGVDTVRSAVSYSAVVNIENIILTGSADINATGNTLTNQIYGNAGDNIINSGGSADFMRGGLGDDYYFVTEAGDLVSEGSDLDVSTGVVAGGVDTVASTISYSLGVGVENLNLIGSGNINGTGNTGNNVINGNSGANVINGGQGADTMAGAGGNDTYIVDNDGDVVNEAFTTGGVDTVVYDVIGGANAYTLGANVENFRASANIVNGLTVTGNALANTITGGAGNDFIDGGAGADTLIGGSGADTFLFQSDELGGAALLATIIDFNDAEDIVDLTGIDADSTTAGNQAFTWASGGFTGQAGQAYLSYDVGADLTTLALDIDGDGVADYEIHLEGEIDQSDHFLI